MPIEPLHTVNPHIFLSYSRKDDFAMRYVLSKLEQHNLRVWWDQRDIPSGNPWSEEIAANIKNSHCILVLLSPSAKESHNVQNEYSHALDNGIKVFTALVGGSALGDIVPLRLNHIQHADLRSPKNEIEKLIQDILNHIRVIDVSIETPTPLSTALSSSTLQLMPSTWMPPLHNAAVKKLVLIVETAAKLMPFGRSRACIFYVDRTRSELYIIAATNNFDNKELKTPWKIGNGVVGTVWQTKKSLYVVLGRQAEAELRINQGLDDDQMDITKNIDQVIAVPIQVGNQPSGEVIGVLSLDVPKPWSQEDTNQSPSLTSLKVKEIADKALELIPVIIEAINEETIASARPLDYYTYLNLSYILQIARLLPAFPLRSVFIRSAIFYFADNHFYILASTRDFDNKELVLIFDENQGAVGHVRRTRSLLIDNRNMPENERRQHLRDVFHMTHKQIEKTLPLQSILGIPVFDNKGDEVIAILSITSTSPLSESRLNHPAVVADAMRLARLISNLLELDSRLGR